MEKSLYETGIGLNSSQEIDNFNAVNFRKMFERGIEEFNCGDFFAAHDTWEELWMEERGEPRRFLQGLIQGAVGTFHAMCGNLRGAASQITKSLEKLEGFRDERYWGIDVDGLARQLERLYWDVRECALGERETINPALIPAISYTFDPAAMQDR